MTKYLLILWVSTLLFGCSAEFLPDKKIPVDALRSDLATLKTSLEKGHPGLYWYSTKAQIDSAFEASISRITAPLTEAEFRREVDRTIVAVRCGHTSSRASKGFTKWRKKHPPKDIPISVYENAGKLYLLGNTSTDSTLRLGQEIVSIDGRLANEIFGEIYRYQGTDGYNQTAKLSISLSNFPAEYRFWYGEKPSFTLVLKDSLGNTTSHEIRPKPTPKKKPKPAASTANKVAPKPTKVPASVGNNNILLSFSTRDTTLAILKHRTFGESKYKKLYRRQFTALAANPNIKTLVIDLRSNGGGKVSSSNLLMRYLMDRPFTPYRSTESLPQDRSFGKYLTAGVPRAIFFGLFTTKTPSGGLRIRYSTRELRPIKTNGFRGRVIMLTNGSSFSASSITSSNLQFWKRAEVVGRETGGGKIGCSAWSIPNFTMPASQVRVRFPLFKVISASTEPNIGRGVMPDHPVVFTPEDFLKNKDPDMEKVYSLLKK